MDFDVGTRLKTIRSGKKLSQRELAAMAEITNGMISMIEQNRASPSVSSLKKILNALGMTLAEFFAEDESTGERTFYRNEELIEINPSRIYSNGSVPGLRGLSLKQIGKPGNSNLQMLYEVYEPGADTGPELYSHEGEEAGFVLRGEITLTVGEDEKCLKEGDAYQFASTRPHRFRNTSDAECVIVSACTPPTF